MNTSVNYVLGRLGEPSTWAGIAVILGLFGVEFVQRPEWADLVKGVTSEKAFDWPAESPDEFGVPVDRLPARRLRIAAYDFGMKWNILRRLSAHGCDVRVSPATTPVWHRSYEDTEERPNFTVQTPAWREARPGVCPFHS